MKRKFNLVYIALFAIIFSVVLSTPAQAQLVVAKGLYRVVEIDRDKTRIGVCKIDADPNKRQLWVYVQINTKIILREQNPSDKTLRDVAVNPIELFSILYKGDVIRVNGGRDWALDIDAKDILIYPDDPDTWYQQ